MHKNQNILSFWGSGFFIRLYFWNYNIIALLPPFSLPLNLFFMRYSLVVLKFVASCFDCSTVKLQNTADSQNAEDRWSCELFRCLFYCGKGPCWEQKRWLVVRNRLQWSSSNNQNICYKCMKMQRIGTINTKREKIFKYKRNVSQYTVEYTTPPSLIQHALGMKFALLFHCYLGKH